MVVVALPFLNICLANNPSLVWNLPAWLQAHYFAVYWGTICGIIGYGFGYCCAVKFATKERWRWPLLLFAVSSIIAIQSYAFWKTAITRPLAFAAARITADGVVLQSSNASCFCGQHRSHPWKAENGEGNGSTLQDERGRNLSNPSSCWFTADRHSRPQSFKFGTRYPLHQTTCNTFLLGRYTCSRLRWIVQRAGRNLEPKRRQNMAFHIASPRPLDRPCA